MFIDDSFCETSFCELVEGIFEGESFVFVLDIQQIQEVSLNIQQ